MSGQLFQSFPAPALFLLLFSFPHFSLGDALSNQQHPPCFWFFFSFLFCPARNFADTNAKHIPASPPKFPIGKLFSYFVQLLGWCGFFFFLWLWGCSSEVSCSDLLSFPVIFELIFHAPLSLSLPRDLTSLSYSVVLFFCPSDPFT